MFLTKPLGNSAFEAVLVREPVYLRRAVVSDHAAWAELREDSRAHLVAWEQDWSPDETTTTSFRRRLRYYERHARNGSGLSLFAFRRDDQRLVGGVTLTNIRYGAAQTANLGYWIGRPFVRRGYGCAAVEAMLGHAFNEIGLNRVEAACQPQNVASLALLQRCGFSKEGSAREYLNINGAWRDHDLFAITASDFRARENEP